MALRRRLIPVTALVVAIGASAAGAATAAATGSGSGSKSGTSTAKTHKPVDCGVKLPGDTFKKGAAPGTKPGLRIVKDTAGGDLAKLTAQDQDQTQVVVKSGAPRPADACETKKVEVVSLDKLAADLGVSKAALVQALTATKQWAGATRPAPGVAAFDQHLAGLLNVPAAKVAAVLKPTGLKVTSRGA